MSHFHQKNGRLWVEGLSLEKVARQVGTPAYVYSAAALRGGFQALDQAFAGSEHLICYSVKASSNLSILKLFAGLGSGFDIVSGGELARVLKVGGQAQRTVFSGVGKTPEELAQGLSAGLLLFNVESAEELTALDAVARKLGKKAPFALRVNPDVDARTHRYISTGLKTSKFGVPFGEARALYQQSRKMRGLVAAGVDCHIGSQLTESSPVRAALAKVAGLYRQLAAEGHPLRYLDVGGGLGITYREETPPSVDEYAKVVTEASSQTGATLILEPGRVLVGNAGLLLTRVLYRKKTPAKRFLIVDAGMNDLVRPALYEAHHQIQPVVARGGRTQVMDVVGPVCESSDVLGHARRLVPPEPGDLLAVRTAGAYGMSMASNYNSRPRPPEVLVDGRDLRIIRAREAVEDLWRGEAL